MKHRHETPVSITVVSNPSDLPIVQFERSNNSPCLSSSLKKFQLKLKPTTYATYLSALHDMYFLKIPKEKVKHTWASKNLHPKTY